MLQEINIKNFKSIADDTIALGRVNLFIGENGCGKSNILEALMFASLATTYETIDADLLSLNGIRVAKPALMMSAFEGEKQRKWVEIKLSFLEKSFSRIIFPEKTEDIYAKWYVANEIINNLGDKLLPMLLEKSNKNQESEKYKEAEQEIANFQKRKESENYQLLQNYIIYTLNTPALRGIPEFIHSRKGIYGENLDVMIGQLAKNELAELREYMYAINWLDDFFIDEKDKLKIKGYKLNQSKSLLYFKDKFMQKKNNTFSVENANEGILHVLFYLTLLISSKTAKLFAIDNIETGLNPHLCRHLMKEMCKLAKEHDKQVLITTHNPAILDGMNLYDDEIRLFEVKRNDKGQTKTRRIKIKPDADLEKYKLSELWTRGFLGAISKDF